MPEEGNDGFRTENCLSIWLIETSTELGQSLMEGWLSVIWPSWLARARKQQTLFGAIPAEQV